MDDNKKNEVEILADEKIKKGGNKIRLAMVASALVVAGVLYAGNFKSGNIRLTNQAATYMYGLQEKVLPSDGVVLPVIWGDMGSKLVNAGVIDAEKLKSIYSERGDYSDEYSKLLLDKNNGKIKITKKSASYILNLFWALGLGNKNQILDRGEMVDPQFGGAGNFASTGGWTISTSDAMEHYSHHKFLELTPAQQALIERVSKGIYRPCCNNSTHFSDCNHGMAMLGFLELMASQNVSEKDMWKAALTLNSYWFPSNYMTIAAYMKSSGVDWSKVDPQEVLGANYSSTSGYSRVAALVTSHKIQGGGGCSV